MNAFSRLGAAVAAVAFASAGLTTAASSQAYTADTPVRIEAIPIQTLTLTTEQFLTGNNHARPTTIAGSLLVAAGQGPGPLVVFVAGSSGYGPSYDSWADQFLEMGISVFFLDTYAGRGYDAAPDPPLIDWESSILDVYRALGVLADHPRVDPDRIAVMGWSRGAHQAVYSSMTRFHELWNTSGVEPAAYIGLYTPCYSAYIGDTDLRDRPVRLFHGTADDVTPIEPCRGYVERLVAAGVDITLTEYEGAHHAYGLGTLPQEPLFLEAGLGFGTCEYVEETPGALLETTTGEPFLFSNACVAHGINVAYSPLAISATEVAVKDFLRGVFQLD